MNSPDKRPQIDSEGSLKDSSFSVVPIFGLFVGIFVISRIVFMMKDVLMSAGRDRYFLLIFVVLFGITALIILIRSLGLMLTTGTHTETGGKK